MNHPVRRDRRRPYMMAVVLGTALSGLGGAAPAAGSTDRAVADISRYCTACWRNARLDPSSWPDCTQEVFCRLLERVSADDWGLALAAEGDERRELIRAIDTVKKRSQRARRLAPLPEQVADRRSDRDGLDREAVRRAADEVLSDRQKHILQLSFAGWPVNDIAAKLELAPARVSDEKYKAVQRLRARLAPLA